MIHAIGKILKTVNGGLSKLLDEWDELDLTTLIGYGPWFILGIWMIFESRGDMPLLLAIFLVMILISVGGAVTSFLASILKIIFMGVWSVLDWVIEQIDYYEDTRTGIGKYIKMSRKADGDSLNNICSAKYLHD